MAGLALSFAASQLQEQEAVSEIESDSIPGVRMEYGHSGGDPSCPGIALSYGPNLSSLCFYLSFYELP